MLYPRLTLFLIATTIAIIAVAWIRYSVPSNYLDNIYEEKLIDIPHYELYDMGTADINGDGYYDIYTVNHSARQAMLINDQTGQFENNIDALSLGQDGNFPNSENQGTTPQIEAPGIYIYRLDKKLHFRAFKNSAPVSLEMHLPWPIAIVKSENTDYKLNYSTLISRPIANSKLEATIAPDGELIIIGEQAILELTHSIIIDDSTPLDQIFIGFNNNHPEEHEFKLTWRDRHAMAWIDMNGDNLLDVFIARGGVKGQIKDVAEPVHDELLISYKDKQLYSEPIKLDKRNCPARQTAWIDYDQNGLADIYISCGRDLLEGYPNLLYSQISEMKFVEIGEDIALDFDRISVFRWVDADSDGDMDLLAIDENKLFQYINSDNNFHKTLLADNLKSTFVQIQTSDYDNDGDFDAFAVSRAENLLLTNNDGRYEVNDPSEFGLPAGGRNATWIDYDNDGLLDLHAVPGGLFKQINSQEFSKTGLLDTGESIDDISQGRCSWADYDNSGGVDVVCVTQRNFKFEIRALKKIFDKNANTRFWKSEVFFNQRHNKNNWIHFDLTGPPGNRSAIGSKVRVITKSHTQTRMIGESEGSHYSQGNYRLYFGLGTHDLIDTVEVFWSNGKLSKFTDLRSNQIKVIKYPQ